MRVRNIYECDFGVFLAKRDLKRELCIYLFIPLTVLRLLCQPELVWSITNPKKEKHWMKTLGLKGMFTQDLPTNKKNIYNNNNKNNKFCYF